MITEKIKALFQFIEFLHSNTENFKQFDNVVNELHLLDKKRSEVRHQKNFKDKLKYDEVQAEIKQKMNVISVNIIQVMQAKAIELNICDLNNSETLRNWNVSEIDNLKKVFSENDIPIILKQIRKYIEFRTKTNCTYFQDFFFNDLDKMLKELFDFFKESTENEFEAFETKTIQVNSIRETVEQLQKGQKKIRKMSIPTKAKPDQILEFWFKLQGNNERGQPYWESEKEIEHFVNQNFEGFPGVDKIRKFTPEMSKEEFWQVTWLFFKYYGNSKTKPQYVKLLQGNFIKFEGDGYDYLYKNIAYKGNENLRKLYNEFAVT